MCTVIERFDKPGHPYDGTPRTVELTVEEDIIADAYEGFLDDGAGIQEAAKKVLDALPNPELLDPEFVAWLSDGTLVVKAGTVVPA